MKKLKFILAAVAILATASLSAQTVNDVTAKYNEAAKLLNDKNYAEAVKALEQVVDMGLNAGPDASAIVTQAQKLLPAAYFNYGGSLVREGENEKALAAFEQSASLGELYDRNYANRGKSAISQVYMMMGANAFNSKDYQTAAEVFAKGYQVNPTDTKLGLYLAESYAESGDYDKGLETYRDIVALESRHSRYKDAADSAREKIAYYQILRASEAAKAGNRQDAYTYINDIIITDPDNAEGHLMRVQLATNAQDWARVIEWGEAAAEAQATAEAKSNIYYMLGAAYQNTENKDMAIANYNKVTAGGNVSNARTQITALNK